MDRGEGSESWRNVVPEEEQGSDQLPACRHPHGQDYHRQVEKAWRQDSKRPADIESGQADVAIFVLFTQQQSGDQQSADGEEYVDPEVGELNAGSKIAGR